MTQPVEDANQVPDELVDLAAEFGIGKETIAVVHQIVLSTPDLEAYSIAANGQPLGNGSVRVAREYDHMANAANEGFSLIVIEAPEAGVQFGFLVNREQLIQQLTVEVPDVPSAPTSDLT